MRRRNSFSVLLIAVLSVAGCTSTPPPASSSDAAADSSAALPSCAWVYPSPHPDGLTPSQSIVLDLDGLIGLTRADATKLIEAAHGVTSVAGEDGVCHDRTASFRPDRIDIILENDIVTWATFG